MATKCTNILIEPLHLGSRTFIVWTDATGETLISIEGVAHVKPAESVLHKFYVVLDPRYDRAEVLAAIRALP